MNPLNNILNHLSYGYYTENILPDNTFSSKENTLNPQYAYLCFLYATTCVFSKLISCLVLRQASAIEIFILICNLTGLLVMSIKYSQKRIQRDMFILIIAALEFLMLYMKQDIPNEIFVSLARIPALIPLCFKRGTIGALLILTLLSVLIRMQHETSALLRVNSQYALIIDLIVLVVFVCYCQRFWQKVQCGSYDAISQLETRVSQQKEFIYTLSHEIRNPLNVIQFNLKSLQEQNSDHLQGQKLQNTRACCDYLLNLLTNVLDISKAESEKIEINPSDCDPTYFFHEAWRIFSDLISNKGLKGHFKIAQNVPRCLELDNKRLLQILFNILTNSLKFTLEGTISMNVSWLDEEEDKFDNPLVPDEGSDMLSSRRKISLNLSQGGQMESLASSITTTSSTNLITPTNSRGSLVIEIIDTGVGMSKADNEKLFGKFTQFDKSVRSANGTGLGLWISKRICKAMNGDIEARSEIGMGTTFIVKLRGIKAKSLSPFINTRFLREVSPTVGCFDSGFDRLLLFEEPNFESGSLENSLKNHKIDFDNLRFMKQDFQRFIKGEVFPKESIVTLLSNMSTGLNTDPFVYNELREAAYRKGVKLNIIQVLEKDQNIEQCNKRIYGVNYFIKRPLQISLLKNLISFEKRNRKGNKDIALVADNDESLREAVRVRALDAGLDCLEAATYDEALFLMKKFKNIKQVFLDINPKNRDEFFHLQSIQNYIETLRSECLEIIEIKKSTENPSQIVNEATFRSNFLKQTK